MNKLPVISYTFLRDFENCPRKAHHLHVLKDLPKEAPSAEMKHGIETHERLERAIKSGWTEGLDHQQLQWVQPLLGRPGVRAEAMLGVTREGARTDFFAADVWLRGKLDVVAATSTKALLLDWKTGKPREDPHELQVQAVLLHAAMPSLQRITGRYVWLKAGRLGTVYDLSDTAAPLAAVRAAAEKAEASDWRPTPNPLCGWCRVTSCEHNTSGEK